MTNREDQIPRTYRSLLMLIVPVVVLTATFAFGQDAQVQERLADLKAASAKNNQVLAQYSWQEQDTISIKGDVKKQMLYRVQLGPDGKPQKTQISESPETQSADTGGGRRGGRLKQHVVEKKKEDFKEYAQKVTALAHTYAHPDPQKLQEAASKGSVSLRPGGPNEASLVINSLLKPNDSVILVLDRATKALNSVQVPSYLDSPDDAVKMTVTFGRLPDGTNHVANVSINGISKQLTVAVQNSNYRKF